MQTFLKESKAESVFSISVLRPSVSPGDSVKQVMILNLEACSIPTVFSNYIFLSVNTYWIPFVWLYYT